MKLNTTDRPRSLEFGRGNHARLRSHKHNSPECLPKTSSFRQWLTKATAKPELIERTLELILALVGRSMLRPYISSVFRRGDPARQVRLGIKKLGMPSPRQDIKLNPDFSSQRFAVALDGSLPSQLKA
jgi:hypothetical protein